MEGNKSGTKRKPLKLRIAAVARSLGVVARYSPAAISSSHAKA
jgi:hypothetical protein